MLQNRWRSRENAEDRYNSKYYQAIHRDTSRNSGTIQVNELRRRSGHTGNRFGTLVCPNIKRVSRMIGFCLTSLDRLAMWQLAAVLYARLHSNQRKFLAAAVLLSLTDDEYQTVSDFMEGEV